MKVLAVDDDTMVLELLEQSLTLFGHSQTLTAPSATKALETLQGGRTRVDCFLLDIQMPDMDGIELCCRIREMRAYARTPIIMLTAMSQTEYVERAFAAGATDYLTKPFDFLELAFRLRMAEMLVTETHRVAQRQGELAKMRLIMGMPAMPRLDHPTEIEGVHSAISYTAFENYIMQLSRSSQFSSSVFAVGIADIEKIHASASASEYIHVLHSVAKAIANTLNEEGSLLSYRGNGLFVCVSHQRSNTTADDIRCGIDQFLRISQDRECRGRPITVSVGDRANFGAISRFGALQPIHRAIVNLGKSGGKSNPTFGGAARAKSVGSALVASAMPDPDIFEDMLRESLTSEVALIDRNVSPVE